MNINGIWPFILLVGLACKKEDSENQNNEGFETIPVAKPLTPALLDEASGIADSKANPGYLMGGAG